MFECDQGKLNEKIEAIYRGDLVWLTYGSTTIVCLVLDVLGTPWHKDPIRNFRYKVWGDGRIITIQGWHLQKIQ